MKKLITLLILCGGLFGGLPGAGFGAWAQAAELTTRLDRTTVLEDETVRLIIEQEGRVNGQSPDFSPLLKNFEILDQTQSTQMEIVNGRNSWTNDFDVFLAVRSDLMVGLTAALAEAGIEIPFPQRDLHLKTLPESLQLEASTKPRKESS